MSAQIRFGTDGIRGPAHRFPIVPEVALAIGRAAARLARRSGGTSVVIARDSRSSGPMLEAAVSAGVAAEGLQALVLGVLPTPGLAFVLAAGTGAAGVMITASHNPDPDNGFKLFGAGGHKVPEAELAEVEGWLAATVGHPEAVVGQDSGVIRQASEPGRAAYDRALARALPDLSGFKGRKIAIDLANGAGVSHIPWLQAAVPASWVFVGEAGPINERCGSQHPEALQQRVLAEGCDLGVALDGDGDRCRIVDERGRLVSGDAVAWFLARHLAVKGLAVTVMSTGALEAGLPGVRVVRTAVGDKYVHAAMVEGGLELGSEESGHVLFHDTVAGDGLITGLRVAAGLFSGAQPASAVFAGFRELPRAAAAVRVARRPPVEEVEELARFDHEHRGSLGPGGRIFLRYSGTEPVLRILVEGHDEAVVKRVCDGAASLVAGLLA